VQIQQWVYERRYPEAIDVLKNAIAKRDRPLMDWQRIYYLYTLALLQQFSGDASMLAETWQQVKTDAEKLRPLKENSLRLSFRSICGVGDETKALASLDTLRCCPMGSVRAAWFAEVRARIAVQVGDKDLRWSN